ncbi:MAG TPA: hypothetical protein VL860_09345 [Planctomycetota bacterium]|nr:hypothetical protein [Planctomycetota bacterium]
MTQETKSSSSTDRQARIAAAKFKRAMFKLVMLVALLAIAGVLFVMIKEKLDNAQGPNFLGQLETEHPIKRDPPFDPAKIDPAKLKLPDTASTAAAHPVDSHTPPAGTGTRGPGPKGNFTDDAWGQEMLKRAQGFYEDTNFVDGAKVLEGVSAKAINPDLMSKLIDLKRRCDEFERATKHVQPLNLARDDNKLQLWQVAMGTTDYIFNVPKLPETGSLFGEAIKAAAPVSAGSMKLSFDPNDNNVVAKKITRDDLLKDFANYFKSVETASGLIGDPNTCYDLVYLARKMCLKAEQIKYLETADKICQSADAHIDNVFRDRCIALALERAVFYDNLNQHGPAERILKEMVDTLAGYDKAAAEADELRTMFKRNEGKKTVSTVRLAPTAAAAPAKAPAGDDDDGELTVGTVTVTDNGGHPTQVTTPPKNSGGKTTPASSAPVGMAAAGAARGSQDIDFDDIGADAGAKAADKIAQADKFFREGIDHMRKGTNMNGGADDQGEIAKAADDLDKAADLYDAAADANKASNKALADRLYSRSASAGEYAYGMHKRQTLNFYPGAKRR